LDNNRAVDSSNLEEEMRKIVAAGLGMVLALATCGLTFAAEGGTETSVTGNLRDGFCNTVMGAQGPSHKQCAISCASAGIPVVMVEKGTNKSYILIPAKDDSPLPKDVISRMEDDVTVTGKVYQKNGTNFLMVESVK
jgi:hypothetical protein